MSLIAMFYRLPDADRARLLENPDCIEEYLEDSDEPPKGFGPFALLDVDKSWHAIHYVLTGTRSAGEAPLNFVATGGTPIGDLDVGHGPVRSFTVKEVRQIADALAALPPQKFSQRFDPAALRSADIYPPIWDRPPHEDDTRGYVVEYYDTLRSFVTDAARKGEAMLAFIA
jgi:hypothetical protein